jgi:hypothetical protein
MADVRRDVGDIRITNYVDPGVQDKSIAAGLAAVGQAGLDIDQRLGENALRAELEDLETIYKSNSPAVTGGLAPDLTEADRIEIMSMRDKTGKLQRAVAQGAMNFDQFRIFAEGSLRAAIARRPGLAAEYRQIASEVLGTDVSGASVEFLAAKENELMRSNASAASAAADAEAKRLDEMGGRIQESLDVLESTDGLPLGYLRNLPKADLALKYNEDPIFRAAIDRGRDQMAASESAAMAATVTTNTNTANRTASQTEMAARVASAGATFNGTAMVIRDAMADGKLDEADMPAIRRAFDDGRAKLSAMRVELLANTSVLGSEFVSAAERTLEEMEGAIKMSFTEEGEISEASVSSFLKLAERMALQDPTVLGLGAARRVLGESAVAAIVNANPENAEGAKVLLQVVAGDIVAPESRLSSGRSTLAALVNMVGRAPNAEGVPQVSALSAENAARGIDGIVSAALDTPASKYKAHEWSGVNGITNVLADRRGDELLKVLPEGAAAEIGNKILVANARAMDAIQVAWTRVPGRGPARFEVRADGTFIQPERPQDVAAARQLESQSLRVNQMVEAAVKFTGRPREEVIRLMNNIDVPSPTTTTAPRQAAPARATTTQGVDEPVRTVAEELNAVWGQ